MALLTLLAFFSFRWLDAIDIFLVSLLLFQLYNIVKGTVAVNVFLGILSIYLLWLLVIALKMQLLGSPRRMPSMTGYGLEITGYICQ